MDAAPQSLLSAAARRSKRREQFDALQRARLIAALIAVVETVDSPEPTVEEIIGHARVSRKTFYDQFRNREDCFLAAFDDVFSRASAIAVEAYAREDSWRAGMRAALGCLLALADRERSLARLCVVHSLGAGERVLLRRDELMAKLIDVVDRGREARASGGELPRTTAEVIAGGVHAVIHRRLVRPQEGELYELLGPLMGMIVLPYLGERVARKELAAQAPSAPVLPAARRRREDPLRGRQIRLTYRTARVLIVLSERPGASNREIAESAEIADQGQASKLLWRLERLGLIENRGEGQPKGAANSWLLTADGAGVSRFV